MSSAITVTDLSPGECFRLVKDGPVLQKVHPHMTGSNGFAYQVNAKHISGSNKGMEDFIPPGYEVIPLPRTVYITVYWAGVVGVSLGGGPVTIQIEVYAGGQVVKNVVKYIEEDRVKGVAVAVNQGDRRYGGPWAIRPFLAGVGWVASRELDTP